MYPGHPWEGEDFGAVEFEWYLKRQYELDILFEVDFSRFLDFCRERGHRSNQLIMKIATRLSANHLPQYMLALNGRPYPVRYPAGYVRPVRKGADMLEHIAVREKEGHFAERDVRAQWKPFPRWLAMKHPKVAVALARFFPREEIKDNYALMVSRNPLRNLGTKVIFFGSHYRTMCLAIPFGKKVMCLFCSPHAFGNINFFEPFLLGFRTWIEQPETIPQELLDKPYREIPQRENPDTR